MAEPAKYPNPLLLHLPADLVEEVDALCRENYMDRSSFIKLALRQMLELYENTYPSAPKIPVADTEDEPVLLAAEDDEP